MIIRTASVRPLTVALFAIAASFGVSPVAAQVSVEVSPLRVELQAGPGSSTTQPITLTNYGKEAVRVRARLTDWDLTRDGTPQFEGAEVAGRYSATAWLRVAPPEQVLEPGASATVSFNATLPDSVEPGGYRTGILFEFEAASGPILSARGKVEFKSRIATLIYINAGAPPAMTELVDVKVRPTNEGLDVVATVKNSGRKTVRTKGTLCCSTRPAPSRAKPRCQTFHSSPKASGKSPCRSRLRPQRRSLRGSTARNSNSIWGWRPSSLARRP